MNAIGSMPMMPKGASPRDQMVSSLNDQVESGEITAEDSDAMLEALDAMHEARMEEGQPDLSSGPPSKEKMQANLTSMLSEQVEAGTISQKQADQLSEMFESGELGGPPKGGPGPQMADGQSSEMIEDFMNTVLEQMQSSSSYDESGEQSSITSVASLLADYKA